MSEIYLIYSKDDIERVKDIVTLLTKAGYTVWPPADPLFIEADIEAFERKLQETDCAIAFWSDKSLSSSILKTTALDAETAGKLIEIDLDDNPDRSITGDYGKAHLFSEVFSPKGEAILLDQVKTISPAEDYIEAEIVNDEPRISSPPTTSSDIVTMTVVEQNYTSDKTTSPQTKSTIIKNSIKVGLLLSATLVLGVAVYAFNLSSKSSIHDASTRTPSLSDDDKDSISTQLTAARNAKDAIALRSIIDRVPNTGFSETATKHLQDIENSSWNKIQTARSSGQLLQHIENYRIDFPDGQFLTAAKELETQHRVFISEAEEFLSELGYNSGPTDGIISKETSDAVKAFQTNYNLDVNGELRLETYEALTKIAGQDIADNTKLGSLYLPPKSSKPSVSNPPLASSTKRDDNPVGDEQLKSSTNITEPNKTVSVPNVKPTNQTEPNELVSNQTITKTASKLESSAPNTTLGQTESPPLDKAKQVSEIPPPSEKASQSEPLTYKPNTIQDCADCPVLSIIPAGRFVMGDMSGEAQEDRIPVRKVILSQSFALASYETTFTQWDACVADGFCRAIDNDMGWGRENRPVIGTSWHDAHTFVEWLIEKTGQNYRLPSEAEWEYSARAGSTTTYTFGDELSELCQYGNGADLSTKYPWRNTSCSDSFGKETAPVGTFRDNHFGLYDMHGNVWEWVEDCWHPDYKNAPTDGSAWTKHCNNSTKVLRGGSFSVQPDYLGSSNRYAFPADQHMPFFGFRVARDITG